MQAIWHDLTLFKTSLSEEELFFFRLALAFVAAGILFIANLFFSRITKSYLKKRETSLRSAYQKILNKIIVNEILTEKGQPTAAFEFYMAELRLLCSNSRFARRLLIAQILEIKKSLTGNSSTALVNTYYAIPLCQESLKKLKSLKWQTKALAIRELAEMHYDAGIPHIKKFLYTRNAVLREESFMALVRLEERPLSFLNTFKGNLSQWMRMNIYHYLSKFDQRNLPVFSQWFNHPNLSVRLFCISMARQFRQIDSLPAVADLIYDSNPKIVGLAVSTLGDLDAFQYRQHVSDLAMHVWRFEKLSRRVVRCLGQIGDPDTDLAVVGKFLAHPSYTIRFEAVSALKKFGPQGDGFIERFNIENHFQLDNTLRHFSEPLLSCA